MPASSSVAGRAVPITFSRHCAQRWSERARPHASLESALYELGAIARHGVVATLPTLTQPSGEPHLIIGDFFVPLVSTQAGLLAVTCKTRALRRPARRPSHPQTREFRPRKRAYRRPPHPDWLFDSMVELHDERMFAGASAELR